MCVRGGFDILVDILGYQESALVRDVSHFMAFGV